MVKNILLTGATGFIGSHLLEKLLKESYNVIVLKRSFSDTWRIKHLLIKVKKLLGWIPKYNLQDGLKQTYNHYLGELNEV